MKKTIITKTAAQPGSTVAVVAGIHGNERIGLMLFESIIDKVVPKKGVVHFIYGNPRAIEQNIRFTETNLNRGFLRNNNNLSYEEKRAHELMDIFDQCDAVLDLHAYNESDLNPPVFAICESASFSIVKSFPINAILSGFNQIQKGSTNGYMEECGKVGIVLELGSVHNPEKYLKLANDCVFKFLAYFDLIDLSNLEEFAQEYFQVESVHRKESDQFVFSKKYRSFDTVQPKECIATDGQEEVTTSKEGIILFPREDTQIGGEAFWFLTKVK